VLFSDPWLAHFSALGIPANRQVGQFAEAGIAINRMMETGENRVATVGQGCSRARRGVCLMEKKKDPKRQEKMEKPLDTGRPR
jgi:hypothetical protein